MICFLYQEGTKKVSIDNFVAFVHRVQCPQGHELICMPAQDVGCDGCRRDVKNGDMVRTTTVQEMHLIILAQVMNCAECDFDLCLPCFSTPPSSGLDFTEANQPDVYNKFVLYFKNKIVSLDRRVVDKSCHQEALRNAELALVEALAAVQKHLAKSKGNQDFSMLNYPTHMVSSLIRFIFVWKRVEQSR